MGTKSSLRPLVVHGRAFVATVQELGGSERDGKRLWARIVSRVRHAKYTLESAYAERLHASDLAAIVDGGSAQFRNLKAGDWELVMEATRGVVATA